MSAWPKAFTRHEHRWGRWRWNGATKGYERSCQTEDCSAKQGTTDEARVDADDGAAR